MGVASELLNSLTVILPLLTYLSPIGVFINFLVLWRCLRKSVTRPLMGGRRYDFVALRDDDDGQDVASLSMEAPTPSRSRSQAPVTVDSKTEVDVEDGTLATASSSRSIATSTQ